MSVNRVEGFTKEEWTKLESDNPPKDLVKRLVLIQKKVFQSPKYDVILALKTQLSAWTSEFIDEPFNVRAIEQMELSEDGIQKAVKEALTSRQNAETALKIAKEMPSLAEIIENLQRDALPEELEEINGKVTKSKSAKDLKREALGGKK